MERDPRDLPSGPIGADDASEDVRFPEEEELDDYDKTIADSFPASDPPPGPAGI